MIWWLNPCSSLAGMFSFPIHTLAEELKLNVLDSPPHNYSLLHLPTIEENKVSISLFCPLKRAFSHSQIVKLTPYHGNLIQGSSPHHIPQLPPRPQFHSNCIFCHQSPHGSLPPSSTLHPIQYLITILEAIPHLLHPRLGRSRRHKCCRWWLCMEEQLWHDQDSLWMGNHLCPVT